jgi:signal transduction histidine kinase
VTDFLLFGRPGQPNLRECDLGQIVERAVDHVRGMAEQKKAAIAARVPEQPLLAQVDPDMLRQVLLNLLLNAIDAVPPQGEIRVFLDLGAKGPTIDVHNTGPAIPGEFQSRIFDPFFTTKDKGSGLGLANAYKIIESHGGELTVASSPGQGTSFVISLPLKED